MTKFLHGFFSFGWLRGLDFLPPLLFRFFLAPIFWIAGQQRLGLFTSSDVIWWDPRTWIDGAVYQQGVEALSSAEGLFSIPAPSIMNGVIGGIEVVAAVLLIIGFAVRWISLPLMGIIILMGLAATKFSGGLVETGKELFMSHGYTTVANTGIESAIVLFLMALALFFMGAGRFFSLDWWIHHSYFKKIIRQEEAVGIHHDHDDPFDVDTTEEQHTH
ncbi:MAG: DoxX family protein [Thiotrichaceae bacterium]